MKNIFAQMKSVIACVAQFIFCVCATPLHAQSSNHMPPHNASSPSSQVSGTRPQMIMELSSFSLDKLDATFSGLKAGVLPHGVYTLKILNLDMQNPGGASRKFSDVFWSTRVFDRKHSVLLNRTVAGDRFPASYYCMTGPSDLRRDSIIIDYRDVQKITGYKENVDWVAGDRGLNMHEEMRMVEPGFYLGKAWSGNFLLHYFVAFTEQSGEISSGQNCTY